MQLEKQNIDAGPQVDMFVAPESPEIPLHAVMSELETLEPDELTPKQALEALYRLKTMI
jgi:DNA mismatch repair protein MutS